MELNNEFRVGVPPSVAWSVLTDVERIAPCMPGAHLQEVEGDTYRGVVKVKVGPITSQYKGKATFLERDEAGGRAVLRAEGRDTRGQGNATATITMTLAADGEGTRVVVATDLTITGKVAQFGRGVIAEVSAKLLDQFVACVESDVLAEGGAAPDAAAAGAGGGYAAPDAAAAGAGGGAAAPDAAPDASPDAAPADADPGAGAADAAPAAPAVAAGGAGAPAAPDAGAAADPDVQAPPEAGRPAVRRIDAPPPAPVDLLEAAGGSMAKRLVPAFAAVVIFLFGVLRWRRRRRR